MKISPPKNNYNNKNNNPTNFQSRNNGKPNNSSTTNVPSFDFDDDFINDEDLINMDVSNNRANLNSSHTAGNPHSQTSQRTGVVDVDLTGGNYFVPDTQQDEPTRNSDDDRVIHESIGDDEEGISVVAVTA